MVHLITPQVSSAVEDLSHAITALFKTEDVQRPKVLWSLHFNVHEYENASGSLPPNVYASPGPSSVLDLDDYVLQVCINQ